MAQVFGGKKFEALFRYAAGLDMDKSDLKRLYELVNQKLHDLLQQGVVTAQANDRDVIQIFDLPLTKGLQDNLKEVRQYEETLNLEPILEQLTREESSEKIIRIDYDHDYDHDNDHEEILTAPAVSLSF